MISHAVRIFFEKLIFRFFGTASRHFWHCRHFCRHCQPLQNSRYESNCSYYVPYTGNMPGTTLVTPKQAQGSLQFFFFAHFRSFVLIFAHFCPFLPIFAHFFPTTQLLAHTTFFWLHIMTQFCFQRFFQAISYRSS